MNVQALVTTYNKEHAYEVTHVNTGEEFVTLYAETDAVCYVQVHYSDGTTHNDIITLLALERIKTFGLETVDTVLAAHKQTDAEPLLADAMITYTGMINHLEVVGYRVAEVVYMSSTMLTLRLVGARSHFNVYAVDTPSEALQMAKHVCATCEGEA